MDEKSFKRHLATLENQQRLSQSTRANGIRYSVNLWPEQCQILDSKPPSHFLEV